MMKLFKELQSAEGLIKPVSRVYVAEKRSASKSKSKKKPQTQGVVKKPKGKCFHCKQSGYWKMQCPVYLSKISN